MNDIFAVAKGDSPADLIIQGGRVFSPEAGTFESGDLLVSGGRVAGLSTEGATVGYDTEVVEAGGKPVVPGFIDTHTHLDTLQCFEYAYPQSLTGGTTAVVTETDRFAVRFGRAGIEALLAATANLPVDVFATLPPGPFYRDVAGRDPPDVDLGTIRDLADHPRIVGVGEVFWNYALEQRNDAPIWSLLATVLDCGGVVCGHGAGCRDEDLSAFATIVDNDHEVLEPADVGERLRRGITPIGRRGSIRDDIDALVAGADDRSLGELCLCSDGMWPEDLVAEGYMDDVVRRVIEAGIDPPDAFRMATLNAARQFGLEDRGSLAPGSIADVLVLEDERRVTVETVVSSGEVVVRNGEALVEPRPYDYPTEFQDSVQVGAAAGPDRFQIPATGTDTVNALRYDGGLVTNLVSIDPPIADGEYVANPKEGVLKAAALTSLPEARDGGFTGFLTGLELRSGAVATTDTWTYPTVLVVGTRAAEMTAAVRRVVKMGGGWAVVRDGTSVTELPMPVAGTCSDLPLETTADRLAELRRTLETMGVTASQPLLAIGTLAALGMPWFKLSSKGYVDTVANEVVSLAP